ncbi:ctr copper transporter family domain-containing protein [Ditylenchus destructor]|uniref:Copper transport protein n=1 Tax=Ditylenchus destructor TaxID=166010 RepID=A0AAD4NCQ0_9BILA|nr:ctr copper transporter family domain-containing protein [Ditylenchus destructor]
MAAGLLHFSNHEIVLFNFWKVGSTLGMIGSVFMVLLIGVLHEAIIGLRYFLDREILLGDSRHSSENLVVDNGIESTSKARRVNSTASSTTSGGSGSVLLRHLRRIFSKQRMLQACLYAIQWTLFFTLILFVMTLNVWLVLAAILGKSIGYLVFIGSPALEKVERIAVSSVGTHGLRLSDARNNLRSF